MKKLLFILIALQFIVAFSQDQKNQMINQAEFFIANGELEKAIKIYSEIFNDEPSNFKIASRLAELYLWTENVHGAINVYETLLKNGVSNYDVLVKLGQWYLWDGRQKDAITVYEKLVQMYPDSIAFYRMLAKLYVWNDRARDAIPIYEKIIELDPQDYETMLQLAQQYVWNEQQLKAIPLYKKLVSAFPDSSNYHWLLCQLLIWNNKVDDSKREIKKFLKKFPKHKEALELAVQLFYYSGEWDRANNYAEALLKIDPQNQTAKKISEEIKANYSNYIYGETKLFRDTNKLERATYPVEAKIILSRVWEIGLNVEKVQIFDGRVQEKRFGYGGVFRGRYNISRGNYLELETGMFKYEAISFPVWRFTLGLNLFDRIYPQFTYKRSENREGAKAIGEKITVDNFTLAVYNQIFNSLGLSLLFDYGIYSDGNIKKTFGSYLNLFLLKENPRVLIIGFYSFEDFDSIYVNSLPYWTPNNLSTYWGEVNVEQSLLRWLTVGIAGAVAKNPKYPTSLNYRIFGKLTFRKFEFCGQYEKYGSTVYNYRFFRVCARFRI
ncbi:tetratricopeptide repeat protein [Candidatus Kryptonium thompsonii]|uniref:tetratricopeptide repeat protein n=1 Tax=Candidatus Kryptonium thompsonii TaxID=1633631 RepID=UPI000707A254|nr:tetratricopeptide repeat protein [Candidatus Kryptonium thompsoni]CUS85641.1 TPR repeat-containing protein [Candidatus Kryptonium thompsoni]